MKEKIDLSKMMTWRKKELWVLEVNDLLENNKISLTRIYKRYFKERKQYMSMEDAIGIATWETPLQIGDKEAIWCYGMSKMCCHNDILDRENYGKIKFVELLEYFARLAESKFTDPDLKLVDKLEKLLEIIFNKFEMKLKPRHVEIEVVSCSEEEHDE